MKPASIIVFMSLFYISQGWLAVALAQTVPTKQSQPDPLTLSLFHFDDNTDDVLKSGAAFVLNSNSSLTADGRFGGGLRIKPRTDKTQAATQVKLPASISSQGSFAYSLWVKLHGVGEPGSEVLDSDMYVLSCPGFYLRYRGQAHRLEAGIQAASWVETYSSGVTINPDQWVYVTVGYDGSELRLIVNGIAQPTQQCAGAPIPSALTIGACGWDSDNTLDLDGWIDELQISSTVSAPLSTGDSAPKTSP